MEITDLLPYGLKQQINEEHLVDNEKQYLNITLDDNGILLVLGVFPKNKQYYYTHYEFKYRISKEDLIDFLTILFYYIPNIDILDSSGVSYFITNQAYFQNHVYTPLITKRISYWENI